MNHSTVEKRAKPVNPLLSDLDENFEWDASIKLNGDGALSA
jgi:hypothetical protein